MNNYMMIMVLCILAQVLKGSDIKGNNYAEEIKKLNQSGYVRCYEGPFKNLSPQLCDNGNIIFTWQRVIEDGYIIMFKKDDESSVVTECVTCKINNKKDALFSADSDWAQAALQGRICHVLIFNKSNQRGFGKSK